MPLAQVVDERTSRRSECALPSWPTFDIGGCRLPVEGDGRYASPVQWNEVEVTNDGSREGNATNPTTAVLPAGFEPASEARKAPILDRTRLRERNGRLVEEAINPFGAAVSSLGANRKLLANLALRWRGCVARSRRSPSSRFSFPVSSSS